MSDEAGANWIAVRTVFNGGPDNVMEGRERSCLFHWEQSLHKHAKKLVPKENRMFHIEFCEKWRLAKTMEESKTIANKIKRWWRAGNVVKENVLAVERWFFWWEKRIYHWGGTNTDLNASPWEQAHVPRTNLSESVHASWLAGEGYKQKISLYDACVSDVINSYIQCTKQHAFLTGRYEGKGPDMEECIRRSSKGHTVSPTVVARVVQDGVMGTTFFEEPVLHGDKETVQRKRKATFANSSHRPGYAMESKQRKQHGRPKKVAIPEATNSLHSKANNMQVIVEEKVPQALWALRRMPIHCSRKCFAMINGKRCSITLQSRSPRLVAPAFWSERCVSNLRKPIAQWMWCCPDIMHTQSMSKQIKHPPSQPSIWTIDKGTNISQQEMVYLESRGFNIRKRAVTQELPNVQEAMHEGNPSSSQNNPRSKKWRHGISKDAEKKIVAAKNLGAVVVFEFVAAEHHTVFHLKTESVYEVHVKREPMCTCPDFQNREKARKPFLACKHLYFVYIKVFGLDEKQHMVMHQPTLSDEDVAFMLSQPRLMEPLI